MRAAEAKALLDTLLACGATAEKVADAAKPLVGRADRPAIDGLIAAGLTAAQVVAACKNYIERLHEKRAADRIYQSRSRARHRCQTDVRLTSDRGQNTAAFARAGSLSKNLKESKEDDDDGDAREPADRIAIEIEKIIKGDGHWPREGWNHASLVEQLARRLKLGQREAIIVDAVRVASSRAPSGPINSFRYFDNCIAQGHAAATAEPQLELPHPPIAVKASHQGGQNGRNNAQSDVLRAADELVEHITRGGQGSATIG